VDQDNAPDRSQSTGLQARVRWMASALRRSDSDAGEPDVPPSISIKYTRTLRLLVEGGLIVFGVLVGVLGLFTHGPSGGKTVYGGFGGAAIMVGFFLYTLRERPKD
jgi:hypothetical protein